MPLTIDIFQDLLACEERFHSGSDKYDVIQKLIDLYAVLIEHYDSIQDPVGYYFNEKLQSLFACQRALMTIRKTNQNTGPFLQTQSLIVQDVSIPTLQENIKSKQLASNEQKKRERQTKAKIAMEIQDQIETKNNDLQTLIHGYQKGQDQALKVIDEELKKQDEAFQQRRLKRERTNLQRKSSRMCSTVCSMDRFEAFESCIEFSTEQLPTKNRFQKEESDQVTEEIKKSEQDDGKNVQPFEEVQVEEYIETDEVVNIRQLIMERASEDRIDTPPQRKKIEQFGMIEEGDDLLIADEPI